MWVRFAVVLLALVLAGVAHTPPQQHYFEAVFQGRCGEESPCSQLCREFHDGTFECGCRDGFELDVDGYSCEVLEANSTLQLSENEILETGEDVLYEKDSGFSAKLTTDDQLPRLNDELLSNDLEVKDDSVKDFDKGLLVKEDNGFRSLLEDGVSSNDINMIAEGRLLTADNERVRLATVAPKKVLLKASSRHFEYSNEIHSQASKSESPLRWTQKTVVALPVLVGAHRKLGIRLRLRPHTDTAPLLLSAQRSDLQGDYFALMLRNGRVELRFDCGSGSGAIITGNKVNMGQWNTIAVYRHRNEAWVRLNRGARVRGRSKGLFSRMTFREPVWLGCAGNTSNFAAKFNMSVAHFVGCFARLSVNSRVYNISAESVVLENVASCTPIEEVCPCLNGGVCAPKPSPKEGSICVCPLGWSGPLCSNQLDLNVPRFNGSSYLRLPTFNFTNRKLIDIKLSLKASSGDGVVVYANGDQPNEGSRFILYMVDYNLRLMYNGVDGYMQVSAPRKLQRSLWQTVCTSVAPKRLTIRLCLPGNPKCCDRHATTDDLYYDVEANNSGQRSSLSPWEFENVALAIGGAPSGGERLPELRRSYDGCVRELTVNDQNVSMVSSALEGLNLDTCPAECDSSSGCDFNTTKEIVPKYLLISDDLYGRRDTIEVKKMHKHSRWNFDRYFKSVWQSSPQIVTEATEIDNRVYIRARALLPTSGATAAAVGETGSKRDRMEFNGNLTGQNFYIHIDDDGILRRLSLPLLSLNVRFRIPRNAGGLLLLAATEGDRDGLRLYVENGDLVFSYSLSDGVIYVRYNVSRVDDSRWHRARAQRNSTIGSLEVDGVMALVHEASFAQRILASKVRGIYIGGAPASALQQSIRLNGCISNVEITDDSNPITLLGQDTCWNY